MTGLVKFKKFNGDVVYINPQYVVSLEEFHGHEYDGGKYIPVDGTMIQLVRGEFIVRLLIDDVLDILGGE